MRRRLLSSVAAINSVLSIMMLSGFCGKWIGSQLEAREWRLAFARGGPAGGSAPRRLDKFTLTAVEDRAPPGPLARPGAAGSQKARLDIVFQGRFQQLAPDAFAQIAVVYWKNNFDAPKEASRRPIGAAGKNLGLAGVFE